MDPRIDGPGPLGEPRELDGSPPTGCSPAAPSLFSTCVGVVVPCPCAMVAIRLQHGSFMVTAGRFG